VDTTINMHPALAGAMSWLLLAQLFKAIGQRIKPEKVSSRIWDLLFDLVTLLLVGQVAMSLAQANLVATVVSEIKGLFHVLLGGAGGTVAEAAIAIVIAILAVIDARKFAKTDELSTAWRPLVRFALWYLVAISMAPWVSDWSNTLSGWANTFGGRAFEAISYILNIPHGG
jgi:hypothetical protein